MHQPDEGYQSRFLRGQSLAYDKGDFRHPTDDRAQAVEPIAQVRQHDPESETKIYDGKK